MPAARFLTSASDASGFPPDDAGEVAFVGRSNSGKSSAINALTGVRKLARVSKTPGRTRLVNFFEWSPGRRIVDLPGYGYAKVAPAVREGWRALLESYFRGRRGLRGVVITVDIRRGLGDLDRTMIEWAASLDLPVLLLLTKADKLSRGAARRQQRLVAASAPAAASLILFSALTGEGVDEARARLEAWLAPAGVGAPAPGHAADTGPAGKKRPRGGNRGAKS
ncbi:MAG TPA: ribosome biogenesis GTP-binding protein YihA/YsxC [Gammaproteobacteria bacterium]